MSRIVVAENGRQKAIRAFSEMYVIAKVSQEKTKYFEIKFRKLSVLDKQSGLSAKCMSMQRSASSRQAIWAFSDMYVNAKVSHKKTKYFEF